VRESADGEGEENGNGRRTNGDEGSGSEPPPAETNGPGRASMPRARRAVRQPSSSHVCGGASGRSLRARPRSPFELLVAVVLSAQATTGGQSDHPRAVPSLPDAGARRAKARTSSG